MPRLTAIDQYIGNSAKEMQSRLRAIRKAIKASAPDAEEKMGYGIPGFWLNGPLVYFAAFKNHLGFYPTPSGIRAFAEELAAYKTAAGSVQFPADQPLPLPLIRKIVRFRVRENLAKARRPSRK